jgi:hypothetical protein
MFLKRSSSPSGRWETILSEISGFNSLQSVYSANDNIFIGASNNVGASNASFSVFYFTDDSTEPKTTGISGEITGAAYDGSDYYLCTKDSGIYSGSSLSSLNRIDNTSGMVFLGIINITPDDTAVITRGGNLLKVKGSAITNMNTDLGGRTATGALAVWRTEAAGAPKLLLAGRQDRLDYTVDSGYTYGYLELELNGSGGIESGKFTEPGINSTSSVIDGDNERYKSTIGKHPVNFIFQADDLTLFASTQKNGVWSYRKSKDGKYQWNAEE